MANHDSKILRPVDTRSLEYIALYMKQIYLDNIKVPDYSIEAVDDMVHNAGQ